MSLGRDFNLCGAGARFLVVADSMIPHGVAAPRDARVDREEIRKRIEAEKAAKGAA
jgi:sRNA-binding carbon storage regulator CsrA